MLASDATGETPDRATGGVHDDDCAEMSDARGSADQRREIAASSWRACVATARAPVVALSHVRNNPSHFSVPSSGDDGSPDRGAAPHVSPSGPYRHFAVS